MKHLFKKGLSLLLAVLMVTSMLPMSTLAAAIADSRTANEDGVYSTQVDTDPPQAEPSAEIGEDITDPVEEVTPPLEDVTDDGADVTDPAEDAADPAEDDLRAEIPAGEDQNGDRTEIPAGEDQNGDRPELPDIGEEPDVPANPLWVNQSVSAIINPDGSWEVIVKTNAAGNSTSRDWGLALIPNAKRGAGTVLPSDFAGDQNDGTVTAHTALANSIKGATGLRDGEFVIVGGSGISTDADGRFTISSSSNPQMPDLDTLTSGDLGLSAPMDVVVIFFAKGADTGTHVVTTTATYGGSATGIPSLVYTLNKAGNTLTLDSATLGGRPWVAPTPSGSWDSGFNTLTVPVYNRTGETVTVSTGTITMPSGVTSAGLTNADIFDEQQADISFTVPASVTSGTITVPISGETDGGDPVSATITVRIINSGYTADEIRWEVTEGYDVSTLADALKTITIRKGSSVDTSTVKVAALVANNNSSSVTAQIESGYDGAVEFSKSGGAGTKIGSTATTNNVETAVIFDGYAAGSTHGGSSAALQVVLGTAETLSLQLQNGLTANSDGTPKTYTFMVDLSGLYPINITVNATTGAESRGAKGTVATTVSVPVTIVVKPPEEEPDEYTYTYTLAYDLDGGSGGPASPVTETHGPTTATTDSHTFTLSFTAPTKSGYVFKGWADSKGATAPDYASGGTTQITLTGTQNNTVSKVVYAVWTPVYTVTYANAGGNYPSITVPTDSNSPYESGKTVTVLAATSLAVGDEKDGTDGKVYKFLGWDNGGTKYYTSGTGVTTSFTITANTTLTASWEEVTYTVKYDGNGVTMTNATSFPDETGLSNGAATTKANGTPTATGKTFTGWNTVATGGGTAVAKGNQYTVAKADATNHVITLYAQWGDQTRKVSYDLNGKTFAAGVLTAPVDTVVTYNTTANLTAVTQQNYVDTAGLGWTFKGWSATSAGTTAITKIDNLTEDKTVYAIWEPTNYTVTFYPNGTGGTVDGGASKAVTVQHGKTVSTLPTATRTGYTFNKWTINQAATGTTFTTSTVVTSDLNVYAQWDVDHYKVNFHYNGKGGTDVTETNEVGTDTALKTPSAVTGYTFGGWYTESTLTNQQTGAVSGTGRADQEEVDLYAKWTPNEYEVTYAAGVATGASIVSGKTPQKFTYDDTSINAHTAADAITGAGTGWQFKNWKSSESGNPTYNGGASLNTTKKTAGFTLTAQWQVQVSFDLNNTGTGYTDLAPNTLTAPSAEWQDYGSTMTAAVLNAKIPSAAASNYTFAGWSTTPGKNQTVVSTTQTFNGPVTYYAQWTEKGGDAQVTIEVDGTATNDGITSVTVNGKALTWDATNKYYKTTGGAIAAGTYNVFVNGVDTKVSITIPKGDVGTATVEYFTVTAVKGTGAATATVTSARVLKGTTGVKLNGTAATYYDVSKPTWTKTSTGGADFATGSTASTLNAELGAINAKTEYTLSFAKLTVTMTYEKGVLPSTVPGFTMPSPNPETVDQGISYTVKAPTATPAATTGWTFNNWKEGNTSYTGGTSTVNPVTANHTFTAQWKVKVTYDINYPEASPAGAVTAPSAVDVDHNGSLTSAQIASPGNMTDYNWASWNTKADGSGATVTTSTKFTEPTTIYAQWTEKTYSYIFNPNSGAFGSGVANDGSNYKVTGKVGATITKPADPTRKDHTFQGWATTNNAAAADSTLPATTMPSGVASTTIYAVWTENTYGYKFDANNGKWADNDTSKTLTGKAGATVTAPADPSYTDGNGRLYRFDGWYTTATGGDKVTTHKITGNSTNGAVTDTVYAHWTPLYTITYDAGGHGAVATQPSDQANVPAGSYNTKNPSALIAASGATWEGNSRFNMANGTHWQFDGWSADGGTTKITAGNPVTITNADVTLTAIWTEQYKVTMKAGVRTDETTSAGNAGGKLNSTSTITWSQAANPYVYVTGAFTVADPQLLNNNSNYIFVKWKATNTGAFTNGVSGNTTQSTNASDTFTPTADTELTPVFALKPTLSPASDGYQLNYKTDASVPSDKWQPSTTSITKATNTLPTYTWTAGDATIGDVTITAPSGVTLPDATAAGTTATLTAGKEYTYNATTGVIQFQREYLLQMEATKRYTVTVNSTTNGVSTPLTATLWAVVTPDNLLKVEIGVKPDTAADYEASPVVNATPVADRTKTASVTVEARNVVKYLDHEETTIVPSNLLTYQWYYAPTASTPGAQTSVNNLSLPTGAVKIGGSTTDNFVNMDNDVYKGKYIFATVVATGTGKNAVVTNSIPVDYDAVIKVTKDGNASITGGNYKVYLLEQPSTGSNAASYASMPAGAVGTTNTTGTNQYATAVSALTGGKTYDIYVNKVEGDTTLFEKTNLTVKTQTNADAAPEAKFYSVNAVDTTLKHAKDKSATPQEVGESFGTNNADVPGVEFYAEGVTAAFDSGMGVFTGSKVTAKTDSDTWKQDYNVDWGKATTQPTAAAPLTYNTTTDQTATTAKATGTANHVISAKTWIGAQLEQNTYTITGNVWVNGYTNGSNAGIVASGATPTLTYKNDATGKTYTFTSTVNNNGVHKSVVTFTGVPRSGVTGAAIDGQYVVEATAKSSNTKSTIIKYIPGQNTGSATDTTIAAVAQLTDRTLAADIPAGGTTAPQFTVVLAASTYVLKAEDTETSPKSAQHSYDASTTNPGVATSSSGGRYTAQGWTGTFAGITAKTYTVVVSNQGNMALDVKLNIKRTMGGTDVYVYGASKAGTDDLTVSGTTWTDGDNNVTFGDLKDSFTLAPKGATGDSVTFTVTIPTDLTVNNAADYAFELTSMESGSTTLYGPSVTYKLTQTVNPRNVTAVAASNSSGTLTANSLAIDNSTTIPTGVTVNDNNTASGDVAYEWYAVPYGSAVGLNTTTGKLTVGGTAQTAIGSGKTYTATANEAGMDVYVVARGVGMSGNVLSAAKSDAITMPYDLKIQVNEDTTPTASKGNYTVYLWPTDGGTFNAATATQATATADADGRYLATGLQPGKTYDVYTNAVGGAHSNYQKSGTQAKLSDFTGNNVPVVTYRSVTINNTTTDNSPYSFTASSSAFIKDADGSTTTLDATADGAAQKPTATLKADTSVTVATTAANKWVQQGSVITATYPAWNKDYDLTWDVGAKVTDETTAATGDVTVSASTTINSKLTLNTYKVTLVVDGPGTLSEVKMNDGTNDFTASPGSFHATGSTTPPIGNGSYTFTVPKGTYTVLGTGSAGTDIVYYKIPANSTTEILPENIGAQSMTVADNTSSFHIQLNSVGQYMLVEDDQKPVDNTTITAHSAGTAGWTGTAQTDGTGGSTLHLPYGYTAARTVTVTVANNSAGGNNLFDVTWTPAATGNSAKITAVYADLDGSHDLLYLYGGTADAPLTAALTVDTGLAVGTHTYTADVTFNTADGDATHQPKVTYTLTVVVDPTKFTAVTVSGQDGSGNVALGDDLSFATYTTVDVDDWTNGKHLTADEYTYQWYHGPANQTATESWSAGTATVTGATAITGATGATLAASEIAKYPGERIYLVISAVNNKNVIEAAISAPVTTGFQPVVKVSVDGTDQSTVSGFDGTGYTATIDDGTTTWNTVWSDAKGGFVPVDGGKEVSLNATGTYTAKVSRVKGDSTNLVALDDKLSNTSTTNTVTAPYFTVNAVETKAFEGITGLGEDFAGDDKLTGPAVSFTLGGAALASGTPVLKGQSVKATTAAWTQDYELTWYTRMDGAATVPTRDTAYEGTPTMTAQSNKVDSTSASGTGYTVTSVNNKLYVGGRLDQILYSVVGTVKGTGTVKSVALEQTAPKTANYIYPDTTTPATSPVKPTTTATGDIKNNETVNFTVVKGTFTITPTEGANTVIKEVSWEGAAEAAGVTVLKDKTVQLKAADPKRTYNFVITVEGADVKLKVSDDAATATSAESNPNAWNDAKNGVERYFNYIHFNKANSANADTYEYVLTLTNAGNKDLKVNAEVYHFDTAPATGFGANATAWNTTKANGTKVYETADGATATLTGASTKTVLGLSEMMGADTIVAAKDAATGAVGSAKAGKITLGADAWSKDTGAYVFHFMGVTNDADQTKVDVYYVLDLKVNRLPIVKVETNNSGSMVGVGETITAKGYDATNNKSLDNVTVNTSTKPDQTNAAAANLTTGDVHFAWVKVNAGATAPVKANLSVTATGTLASTVGTVVSQSETYTLVDGDQDKDFYLVAFAPNYTGNVTNAADMAISTVVKAKRTVGVKVTLNTFHDTTGDYEIYLVESGKSLSVTKEEDGTVTLGEGTWATTWNGTSGRYETAIDVDNKTYEVYAVSYKGGATVLKAIDGTLGKQTSGPAKTEETVPYWNVTFTEDVAVDNTHDKFKSYLPSGVAGTDNAIQKALSVNVSTTKGGTTYETAALTASTTATSTTIPVLAGMNVKVTVDATKQSNNTTDGVKKSWSETDVQALHTLTATGWTDTASKNSGIAYAASITSGNIAVTGQKTFSATLAQKLFDVEFTVKDISEDADGNPTPSSRTKVRVVTLTPNPAEGETGVLSSACASVNGEYGNGDKVTIKNVPVGSFEVKATPVPGTPTLVKGYTWNAEGDDLNNPIDPGKIVTVTVPGTPDNNKHAGNTVQVIEATKVVNWSDTFDDNTGGILADGAFNPSNGFVKADNTSATPKKLFGLTEGYTAAGGAVLEYTVRVTNGGTDDMGGFYLTRAADSNFTYDLTDVTWHKDGGIEVEHHDATAKFTLGPGEYLEFTMTIPEGQAGQKNNYTTEIVPHCDLNAGETLGGGNYKPEYQVKTPVKFKPGEALVLYGGSEFESNTDIALDWPATTDETAPTFTYEVLQLDGTNDAAILAEINGELGLTLTTLDAKPSWLTPNASTGAIGFTAGDHATGVNVKVKGTPADFDAYDDAANGHKVKGEITLYIRATDTKTDETYIIPYVVDVEPGQLKIVGGSFTPATTIGGQLVDKSEFTYTKVTNQATTPLDVIATSAITGGGDTAKGNTTAADGTVNVGDVHTATWTVAPERYVSEVSTQHTFTVTYKPQDAAEKWNYKPDTYTKAITASKPALGLTFGDVLGKADIEQDDAELKIGRAPEDGYSEILTDGNEPYAPEAMEHTKETYRKGEYIVYLDTEPKYTVTLTATGNLKDVKVEETLVGFKVVKGDLNFTTLADGEKKVFELELDMIDGKWVGEHTAKYTVTGTGESGDTTSATYELVFTVKPKTIPKAHVTELTDPWPDQQPDKTVKVTGEQPTDPDKDVELDKWTDKHGNHPIKPPVVTVTPDEPYKDGKDYTVTVELTADPNYTFEDETPEESNYTAGDEGPDDGYDVTVTEDKDPTKENEKVTFTKTTPLPKRPVLKFEDVNANNASDFVEPDEDAVRPTITIMKGQALGKYIISLGAYGEDVTDVDITQTGAMPDGTDWALEPASVDWIYNVESDTAGDKKVAYTLDMTGVDTSKLSFGTYTMSLRAVGKNSYGEDVPATYTISVQVVKAPAGELRFDDVKTGGDTKDPDALGPVKELKRLEPLENPENPEQEYKPYEVVKGDKLGTYTINLGAYGNTVNDVTVTETELKLPDGTVWTLDPVSIATMTPGGDKTTYILDLKDVDTAAAELGVYTLKLKAEGTDINGDPTTATYEIAIEVVKAPAPVLMFDDVNADRPTDVTAPAVDAKRNISQSTNAKLGKYIINLGSYGGTTSDIKFTEVLTDNFIGVYGVTPDCEALAPVTLTSVDLGGGKQAFELDLTGMDTKTAGTYTLTITAKGVDINGDSVEATYTLTITLRAPGGGGGGGSPECPKQVTYLLGLYGTTTDSTMEMVSGSAVKSVPNVNALAGYKFLGWSLIGPSGNMEQDAKRTVVDPKTVTITKDTVFYAVYQPVYAVPQPPIHKHYVIGYPNGNFGPADNIDRASVATIIARAVLPNFVEGADYGNPGGYTDVSGHWAASAIAYCSKYGVFKGYEDGTFKPGQPISRQELALVMARLNGVQTGGSVPFTDIGDAGAWAVDGIYTAYINGWVNGYTDGTFKPVNPIRRDETVKIFNAYLGRGVNAEGLEGLSEYVHSGVASNNTEDGTSEYMTWPDVTKDQWAYYEIIEAANDHEFTVDSTLPRGYAVPEQWTKCWIDEKWRYHDDANDGGPSAVAEVLPSGSGLDD